MDIIISEEDGRSLKSHKRQNWTIILPMTYYQSIGINLDNIFKFQGQSIGILPRKDF